MVCLFHQSLLKFYIHTFLLYHLEVFFLTFYKNTRIPSLYIIHISFCTYRLYNFNFWRQVLRYLGVLSPIKVSTGPLYVLLGPYGTRSIVPSIISDAPTV